MAKKNKIISVDFDFGTASIIPATQQAYKEVFDEKVHKFEKSGLAKFKEILGNDLDFQLEGNVQFPTANEVFVFIMQYFVAETEYRNRDIDNMAKTILDILKGRFYQDDSQVKSLLVGKKIESRIPQNFAYVSIKEVRGKRDLEILKMSGLERSVTLFAELKKKGLV